MDCYYCYDFIRDIFSWPLGDNNDGNLSISSLSNPEYLYNQKKEFDIWRNSNSCAYGHSIHINFKILEKKIV